MVIIKNENEFKFKKEDLKFKVVKDLNYGDLI